MITVVKDVIFIFWVHFLMSSGLSENQSDSNDVIFNQPHTFVTPPSSPARFAVTMPSNRIAKGTVFALTNISAIQAELTVRTPAFASGPRPAR